VSLEQHRQGFRFICCRKKTSGYLPSSDEAHRCRSAETCFPAASDSLNKKGGLPRNCFTNSQGRATLSQQMRVGAAHGR